MVSPLINPSDPLLVQASVERLGELVVSLRYISGSSGSTGAGGATSSRRSSGDGSALSACSPAAPLLRSQQSLTLDTPDVPGGPAGPGGWEAAGGSCLPAKRARLGSALCRQPAAQLRSGGTTSGFGSPAGMLAHNPEPTSAHAERGPGDLPLQAGDWLRALTAGRC